MEAVDFTRIFLSLAFVVGLIWFASWGLKKSGIDKRLRGVTGSGGRLQVSDAIYIDPKRKLVLVRADTREYLLLLSGETTTVIDQLTPKDGI
jgi:flagellar protein FliO/FliZ